MLYILSSSHLNIIGTLEHVPACLHLGFGEAYFRNENEKAKEILAFPRALDRSLLRFYWCGTCSSPESFTARASVPDEGPLSHSLQSTLHFISGDRSTF